MEYSFWIKLFLVNWVINIICIEFLVIRKLHGIIKVDEERDGRYKGFRRNDVKWITRPWLFMTCQFAIQRLLIGFGAMFWLSFVSSTVTKGLKENEPITGIRYIIMRV